MDANTAHSRWIGPDAPNANGPAGDYIYQTTFTLDANVDLSTVVINGKWTTDNAGVDIRINGVSTGQTLGSEPFRNLHDFVVDSDFVTGVNTLDFVVNNLHINSPTGLRVDEMVGTYSVLVPEPASLMVWGSLVGLVVAGRRRK